MRAAVVLTAVLAAFFFGSSSAVTDKVVCYYGSWAVYRPGLGQFDVEDIEPKLCTHLIYCFVGIGGDGSVKVLDASNDLEEDGGRGAFKRFVNLKKRAPGVKTIISIGGWTNNDGPIFSRVTASDSLRAKFVQNVVEFVQKYNFDGFDLDWEYPGDPDLGGRPEDVQNFSKLIRDLRAAFNPHGLVLSASVAAIESAFPNYYEVPQLSQYLDFINVMTYDLHGTNDGKTVINAPLYPASGDSDPARNVKSCIEAWIKHGADPNKIILGMGTFGSNYTLANANDHGLGAPAELTGSLGYNEIVELLRDGHLTTEWQGEQKVPYAYRGNQWIGYDNERSIQLKCEYAKQMSLGGGIIGWIDKDDFLGVSGTKFVLLKTINRVFGRNV